MVAGEGRGRPADQQSAPVHRTGALSHPHPSTPLLLPTAVGWRPPNRRHRGQAVRHHSAATHAHSISRSDAIGRTHPAEAAAHGSRLATHRSSLTTEARLSAHRPELAVSLGRSTALESTSESLAGRRGAHAPLRPEATAGRESLADALLPAAARPDPATRTGRGAAADEPALFSLPHPDLDTLCVRQDPHGGGTCGGVIAPDLLAQRPHGVGTGAQLGALFIRELASARPDAVHAGAHPLLDGAVALQERSLDRVQLRQLASGQVELAPYVDEGSLRVSCASTHPGSRAPLCVHCDRRGQQDQAEERRVGSGRLHECSSDRTALRAGACYG